MDAAHDAQAVLLYGR